MSKRNAATKIKPLADLLREVGDARRHGRTIATANGSFDLFHIGHLRFLQEAAGQADLLIVGVNSDASVRRYKSPDRPVNGEAHRAELVAALEVVDHVLIFDEDDPRTFLAAIKPDVHVNGAEYGENCIESDVVRANGGRIHLVTHGEDVSSTRLLKRIADLYGPPRPA
jgi:rfaE bifunctional protein nucleotidyltransferase chain/domain